MHALTSIALPLLVVVVLCIYGSNKLKLEINDCLHDVGVCGVTCRGSPYRANLVSDLLHASLGGFPYCTTVL